jgi:hypothetical protein
MQGVRRLLLLTGSIGRWRYFLVGVVLMLAKYLLDTAVAGAFDRPWSPYHYLIWPDRSSLPVLDFPDADRRFGLTMLAVALPFIWVGITLTLQRLRDAQLPLRLVVLFFVPLVNLLLIAWLCLAPSGAPDSAPAAATAPTRHARAAYRRLVGENDTAAFLLACASSAAFTVGLIVLSVNVLGFYGFGVFVAAPFLTGWLAAVLYGISRRRTVRQCLQVAVAALATVGVALLGWSFEGLICLVMALPIAACLAMLGALVGHSCQHRPRGDGTTAAMMLVLIVAMPALLAAESVTAPAPALREVRTEVIVDAPPEQVWEHVIAFPPLPEPTDLLFRAGIAYPVRAEIRGSGVGAVRYCVFSTGAFVEPIDVWDAPRRLAFRVTDQPPPMKELSPFDVRPPHLDGFLMSRRGQFRLERLPGGRTLLEGTTWYTNRMWPAGYWELWSDAIIHRIHGRVLDHVRVLSEAGRGSV